MKIPFISSIDSATKKMLIGGIASSLTAYSERIIAETIPEYPSELKQKLDPHLPSNGELITAIAPPVILYVVSKKKPNMRNVAFGSILYSAPAIIRKTAQNAAYVEGVASRPKARASMENGNQTRTFPTPSPPRTVSPSSTSKYIVTI